MLISVSEELERVTQTRNRLYNLCAAPLAKWFETELNYLNVDDDDDDDILQRWHEERWPELWDIMLDRIENLESYEPLDSEMRAVVHYINRELRELQKEEKKWRSVLEEVEHSTGEVKGCR